VLNYAPELSNGIDCKFETNRMDLDMAKGFCKDLPIILCSEESMTVFARVMRKNGLEYPTNFEFARSLFVAIISEWLLFVEIKFPAMYVFSERRNLWLI